MGGRGGITEKYTRTAVNDIITFAICSQMICGFALENWASVTPAAPLFCNNQPSQTLRGGGAEDILHTTPQLDVSVHLHLRAALRFGWDLVRGPPQRAPGRRSCSTAPRTFTARRAAGGHVCTAAASSTFLHLTHHFLPSQ